MIYTDNVKKAALIAYEAHSGAFDKAGMPYIFHPIHIAEQMDDEDSVITALLHDVIEDSSIILEDIEHAGFSENVKNALEAITKTAGESYFEYIGRVKQNTLAAKVKLCDLKHNSDISRISNPSEEDFRRLEKYKKAIEILGE